MFASVVDRASGQVSRLSPDGAPRAELVDGIAALSRLRGALEAAEGRFAAAIDCLADRGIDAAGVLRSVTHCSRREADKRVRRAEALVAMPGLAAEFSSSAIPSETVDALLRAAQLTSPEVVDADTKLLASCASKPADISARDIRDWIHRHQQASDAEERLDRQRKARRAMWFTNPGGMLVCNVEFDPITGAAARARLEAETDALWRSDGGRDGSPDDVRTPAQRRCDAMARLFGVPSPNEGDIGSEAAASGRVAATVVIVADIGVVNGTNPGGRCEIIDTGPVPASILATLGSDTTWRGALFDGPGRPLWLGRKRRLASADQRLMAAIRDRGCVNCAAPASRCQTHHAQHWECGGATNIDLLVMLCPRCHTLLHEGHIRLYRQADGSWICRPTVKSARDPSTDPPTGSADNPSANRPDPATETGSRSP